MKRNRVLYVDDEVFIRDLLHDFLAVAGIPSCGAANADDACRLLAGEPFALVLLDWHLGREPVAEVVRRIRQLQPSVPIIVLSGSSEISPEQLQEIGAAGFLAKPFHLDAIMDVVKRHLECE